MRVHWLRHDPSTTSLGLAEIDHVEEEQLASAIVEYPEVEPLHPKKQLEFLASRQLIRKLCTSLGIEYKGLRKDEFGKPHLIGSDWHVSVSHSYPMVACVLHPTVPCGIDIESPRPQLVKIRHKFLNVQELERCQENVDLLCLHWSAKEAIYKIHGRKSLLFAEQMAIDQITEKYLDARLMADGRTSLFRLKIERFGAYFLVYNL